MLSNYLSGTGIVIIVDCKFSASDLEATKFGERHEGRLEPEQYYRRLGSSMLGLAMPGVGYDTFRYCPVLSLPALPPSLPFRLLTAHGSTAPRLWETMTMGTVAVLEKGVGLDKPVRW